MQDTSEENRFAKIYEVYDIFKNFFGEEHVDLQGIPNDSSEQLDAFILVWWPEVTVKNEYDKSIVIQDLYAKIELTLQGEIPDERTFQLNRARYSKLQFQSDYMHSHINGIPNNASEFLNPCLGRGPIIQTINQLHRDASDINWMLFCQELALFVTVESLNGGPWRRLEKVGKQNNPNIFWIYNFETTWPMKVKKYTEHNIHGLLKEFLSYYINKASLNIGFDGDVYELGMSYYDYNMDISNSFIEFYNNRPDIRETYPKKRLFEDNVLQGVKVLEKRFGISKDTRLQNLRNGTIGNHVCFFKGRDITLVVDEDIEEEEDLTIILNPNITKEIKTNIINSINFRYGREESDSEDTATTNKKVLYI